MPELLPRAHGELDDWQMSLRCWVKAYLRPGFPVWHLWVPARGYAKNTLWGYDYACTRGIPRPMASAEGPLAPPKGESYCRYCRRLEGEALNR